MITDAEKEREVVDGLEIWRVGRKKREIVRSILEDCRIDNEIPLHSTHH
jgi:hypothetical protein